MKARRLVSVCGRRGHWRRRWPIFFGLTPIAAAPRRDRQGRRCSQEGRRQGRARRRRPSPPPRSCEADMPVILSGAGHRRAARQRRRQAARRRPDRRGGLQGRRPRRARAACCSASTTAWSRRRSRQAEANIAKDQATLRDAEATLARREALIDKKIVTEAALDQARFAVEGLKASIAAGQALLESQKTQLDYLTIRAPITGRTGSLSAKLGATVRGQRCRCRSSPSTRRSRSGSTFAVPQSELAALAARARRQGDGRRSACPAAPSRRSCRARSASSTTRSTSRPAPITAKVIAENADEVLWPGPVGARWRSPSRSSRDMLSVPATAVLPAQQGMIAWVIGADNKVAPRTVTVERIVGQTRLPVRRRQGRRACRDRRPDPPGAGRDRDVSRSRAAHPAARLRREERRMNGRG